MERTHQLPKAPFANTLIIAVEHHTRVLPVCRNVTPQCCARVQLPSEGEVGFRENGGAGASGSVAFRRPEHAAQQNMQLARDQLARAAQVAAGQLSMEDLSESGGARRTDLVRLWPRGACTLAAGSAMRAVLWTVWSRTQRRLRS